MVQIKIDQERCKGCRLCIVHCPSGVLSISDRINSSGDYPAVINDKEECTGCFNCAVICPDVAFFIDRGR